MISNLIFSGLFFIPYNSTSRVSDIVVFVKQSGDV